MSLNFIGRTDELDLLLELYENDAKIIRISGRRGIGKTALISEFCKGKRNVFFSCRPTGRLQNLRALSAAVGADIEVQDIQDAIGIVSKRNNDRTLFVIENADGVYDTKSLEIPPNVTLVLVGRELEDADITLKRFDLRESGYFFPDCMPREKLIIYAVTGGIPAYMTVFDRNVSVSDNIESLFFKENGRLFVEPESLLRSMGIREPNGYLSVLSAMADGEDTINGIVKASDDNSTAAVLKHIDPLIDTLIERHVPDGMIRASYRISDNLMRFWLQFVQRHADDIAIGRNHVFSDMVEDEMDGYLFSVYKETCSRYLDDGYGCTIEEWTGPDNDRTCYAYCSDEEDAYFISCSWSRRPAGREIYESLKSAVFR